MKGASTSWKRIGAYALSAVFILAAIELGLRALGSSHKARLEAARWSLPPGEDGLRILFLGESTTAWGLSDSYPAVMGRLIKARYPDRKVHIINEGLPATDTGSILARLPSLIEKYRPDVVFTMMGVNDFWAISEEGAPAPIRWLRNLRIYKLADQIKARIKKADISGIDPVRPTPKDYPVIGLSAVERRALQAAESAMAENKLERAGKMIEGCWRKIQNAPPQCLTVAGKIALRSGHEQKALRFFDLAVSKSQDAEEIYGIADEFVKNFGAKDTARAKIVKRYVEAALKLDPLHPTANWAMGCWIENREQGRPRKGIEHLQTALKAGLIRGDLYACLGDMQLKMGDLEGAIDSWSTGTEINDVNRIHLYRRLITNLLESGQTKRARDALAEAERRLPGNTYLKEFRHTSAAELGLPIGEIPYGYHNFFEFPATRKNYRAVVELLNKNRMPVIALQYPNISAQPLRDILSGLPVTVVSNEENFARALAGAPVEEYFVDLFAEKFGHFSPKGSRLVAESAIEALEASGLLRKP